MGRVCRLGDPNNGGGLLLRSDSSVLVNGRPVALHVSPVTPHPPCSPKKFMHCIPFTTTGSSSVKVGGSAVVLAGGSDTCTHGRTVGSTDVTMS